MECIFKGTNEDCGARSRYLGHALVITSHRKLGDVITNACPRYVLLLPKSTNLPRGLCS